MTVRSTFRSRRTRVSLLVGAGALSAVLLAGCDAPAAGGGGAAATATTGTSTGGGGLADTVAELMQPQDSYPVPTDPVSDLSAIQGKTVFYIPITSQSPRFGVVQAGLQEALDAAGVTLQVCDGKATPTDISACVTQATEAGAAAIVTDAIFYGLAANALDAARAAGIPVLNTNQGPDPDHPADATLSYAVESGDVGASALADWSTLDSGGTANVLANVSVDGPAPAIYFSSGQAVWSSQCPGCVITVNQISATNFAQIPSSTSAALLQTPAVDYVYPQFEQYVQVTQGGVQQAGRIADVKGMTGAATLGSLQQLASDNFLYAVVTDAAAFSGWIDADAVFRMVAGDDLPEYTVPERLFTRDNIGDIDLTEQAQASGEWFGPTDFRDQFRALWGVQ